MKLKFYLRGLGIGITITALFMILAGGKRAEMSDEEIINRAKQLGMVESTTLSQLSSENATEQISEKISESESGAIGEPISEELSELSSEQFSEETSEQTSIQPSESVSEPSEQPSEIVSEEMSENVSEGESGQTVVITINGGDSSTAVSKKLFEAGLVDDTMEYDRFLCSNGYDKKLQVGSYEISSNASNQEMAEILCGN